MTRSVMHRRSIVLAFGALLSACAGKKKETKKESEDEETEDEPKHKKRKAAKSASASPKAAPTEAPAAPEALSPTKTAEALFWYGANYASAHEFLMSGNQEKLAKYSGRSQQDAKDLGLPAPPPVSKERFAADIGVIVKQVLEKHGTAGRALFVCGLQVRQGMGRAADNDEITAKKLNEPLFDVRPQVEDLETSLPRTGIPASVWQEPLAKLKAAPTGANFNAMLGVLTKALAPK